MQKDPVSLNVYNTPATAIEQVVVCLFVWLVGWFYCMSTLIGLFYAQVSLTFMVSNYLQYKKYLHNHFKHFILSCNINILKANVVQDIISNIIYWWDTNRYLQSGVRVYLEVMVIKRWLYTFQSSRTGISPLGTV